MGWWSAGIMGGDTPLDYEWNILGIVGLTERQQDAVLDGKATPKMLLAIQKKFNANLDRLLKWCEQMEDPIAYQVLSVEMMRYGATISPELRKTMIEEGYNLDDADEWNDDSERVDTMENWKMTVENYVDGTPTELPDADEGLFSAMLDFIQQKNNE